MENKFQVLEDEYFHLTEEERQAFAHMTDEEINQYWQAQCSYEEMQRYIEHPDTPEVIRSILNLNNWQEHQR